MKGSCRHLLVAATKVSDPGVNGTREACMHLIQLTRRYTTVHVHVRCCKQIAVLWQLTYVRSTSKTFHECSFYLAKVGISDRSGLQSDLRVHDRVPTVEVCRSAASIHVAKLLRRKPYTRVQDPVYLLV